MPLQRVQDVRMIFIIRKGYLSFSLSLRYRAEFSRGSMTCDDIIVLVDTGMCICEFRFKFFSVLIT